MELDSSFAEPFSTTDGHGTAGSPSKTDKDHGEASSKSFDSIYSLHAEALHEIRRACLLTSYSLSQTVKNILIGTETFCGIVNRRAAGQDGFLSGLGQDQDERMWQDWMDISQLNQVNGITFFLSSPSPHLSMSLISQHDIFFFFIDLPREHGEIICRLISSFEVWILRRRADTQ